jgi:hypothetical protein
MIGVSVIVTSLSFNVLGLIPETQRASFIFKIFVAFLIVVFALGSLTVWFLVNSDRIKLSSIQSAIKDARSKEISFLEQHSKVLAVQEGEALAQNKSEEWLRLSEEVAKTRSKVELLEGQGEESSSVNTVLSEMVDKNSDYQRSFRRTRPSYT